MRNRFPLIFLIFLIQTQASYGKPLPELIINKSFNDSVVDISLVNGARFHDAGIDGDKLLDLPGHASASFSPDPNVISSAAGTISFWLKPHWNSRDKQSHVMLSGRWNDGKQGYMAISYGWWEQLGERRLYFIVNNQESMHCSTPYHLQKDAWTLVTARWRSGKDGDCAIFINADKVAEYRAPLKNGHQITGPVYIGSDKGATDQRQRSADFQIDDLRVYNDYMSDRQIRAVFQAPSALKFTAGQNEWDWMQDVLNRPFKEQRDGNGNLLETRVIFDEDFHWAQSKEEADKILARVKAAGFNVYIPCVWHGRGTHYPSEVTEIDERLKSGMANGHDPLAYLIEKAHKLGIEIHPWFTVMRREWNRYPEYYPEGTPENAYDVHTPEFRDFIVAMILDVVERYDVDGINLDYIRTMGICTSEPCKDDYKEKTNQSLQADYYLRFVSGSARERIAAWQDAAVTDIVQRVSVGIRRLKPGLVLSVDGHPKARNKDRPLQGRDELAWANNDLVDVIFAMDYRKKIDISGIDAVYSALDEPQKLYLLLGNFDRIDGKAVSRQGVLIQKYINFVRRKWPGSGFGFYIFNMLNDEQTKLLKKDVFYEIAYPDWLGSDINNVQ